ncbi:MAG: 2-dehydro-3-deoxygalactonokinase [Ferruginibacter sp.]
MEKFLLSCDWGTSSFRLRLVDLRDGKFIAEHRSGEGISSTFEAWKKVENNLSREDFFRQYLKKEIKALSVETSLDLTKVVLVISGMASSSIGMNELPYAALPFALNGKDASVKIFEANEQFPYKTMLISGVRNDQNAMRGEETQLIGLVDQVQVRLDAKDAIFIFPGTHSKHIYIQDGQLINFETYMTGELFDVIASHSILKDSIDTSSLVESSADNNEAFLLGIVKSADNGIMRSLFTVRTNQLFNRFNKKQNTHYLSGLLIGAELQSLIEKTNSALILCSGSSLFPFYTNAIEVLGLTERSITLPAELVDKAAAIGHIKIFNHNRSLFID